MCSGSASKGYFAASGCSDAQFAGQMALLAAALQVLRVHLHQFVLAKVPVAEFGMTDAEVDAIRELIFKFMTTPAAARCVPALFACWRA